MKILWLSWRDIKNPDSGGAEKVAIETASRFVSEGNSLTIFSSTFEDARETEKVRGVKIIRRGNQITCRFHAFIYYLKHRNFDIIIDEINTIPFFSVLYAKNKSLPLIHQLAKEYWFREAMFPISLIGYILEPLWLRLYARRPTLALSNSTKEDLNNIGFKSIITYNPGINVKPSMPSNKKNIILFVGRLTKSKNPADAIKAFFQIHNKLPNYKLVIIGKGDSRYVNSLKKLVLRLKLKNSVEFTGYISDSKKINLFKKAKIVLIPSVREGWNLVATEANATACIPIGYNVPGLRDSIINGKTGVLTKINKPEFLATSALKVLMNRQIHQKIALIGVNWSKKFTWDKTFLNIKQIFQRIPLKILWLSWRDIKNPDAGGAEKVAIETTKRFVKEGAKVTIFTSGFKNSARKEIINNVEVIRSGNLLTCRLKAFLYYLKNRDFDVIIDEINTIPFFSVLYAKDKTIALIHQLAREYWFTQTFWPFSNLGYYFEPLILKLYRHRPTLVVSKSTYQDLKRLRFADVEIIREGLDFKPVSSAAQTNLILFIGRLTPAKGPKDAIAAFKIISQKLTESKLTIIGQGDPKFTKSLKIFTKENGLTSKVSFKGFISQKEKIELLKKAKIILIPSIREGWNLVATEASATCCVPIAYDVPGLRDSIKNGQTGILVANNPQALAQGAILILKNDLLRSKMAEAGYLWSKHFSWENTFEDTKDFISKNNQNFTKQPFAKLQVKKFT